MSEVLCDECEQQNVYWCVNLKVMSFLFSIWFIVLFVFGILFVELLNQIKFGGFLFGFWFVYQGLIYVFVVFILVYVVWMDCFDKCFGVD